MRKYHILIFYFISVVWGEHVNIKSDGPVTLDAPITFTGILSGVRDSDEDSQYRWTFTDNASPGHYNVTETDGSVRKINYSITFPSSQYDEWTFDMTLIVHKYTVFWWKEVGKATVSFNVTRTLNGKLVVQQNGHDTHTNTGQSIISSVKKTDISVNFHDPSNFISTANKVRYFWSINTVPYGLTKDGLFSYNFSTPGEYLVEATIVADFNETSSSPIMEKLNQGNYRDAQEQIIEGQDGVKMGVFQRMVVSKAPISNLTVVGEQLLKHGQLVNLDILCNGSGPWLYCWQIEEKGYNITGNETCQEPLFSKICDFTILWYFKQSDTYNLLVIVSNDVSSHIEVIPVTIYDTARQLPVSIVIIPVASSIVVVIILISGIGLYTSFKRNLAVEVADFDFNNAEEEDLQYKTFWERLRESFGNAFTGNSETDSDGSSVSGRRSVQLPGPGGIGYGSIT